MSFLIIYSLVLGTILTLSVFISSCTYCLSTCAAMVSEEDDGELPECLQHLYA
jgi:hypothetical protein